MSEKNKPLRQTMPETAAFIDACRQAFGAESVNDCIRAGMAGLPDYFHATEGCQTVGTAFLAAANAIKLSEMTIRTKAEREALESISKRGRRA